MSLLLAGMPPTLIWAGGGGGAAAVISGIEAGLGRVVLLL